jgi:hypothetical protein
MATVDKNLWAEPRVENCARNAKNTSNKTNVVEIECCGSFG